MDASWIWIPLIILSAAGFSILAMVLWAPGLANRLFAILVTHTLYRLRVLGQSEIPKEGGALLVCNHVSLLDGMFLLAASPRPIRFLVDEKALGPRFTRLARRLGFIAVPNPRGPKEILRAFREAGAALERGELVCVFAEGQVTRIGNLLPFKRGFERLLRGRNYPVLPAHLDRVWGSLWSFEGRRFLWKWPRRFPYPVTVSFGPALPPTSTFTQIRREIQELGARAWTERKRSYRPLHHRMIRTSRRHPRALACIDPMRGKMSRFQVLTGSIVLARVMKKRWKDQDFVGILLPPSAASTCFNLAATLGGRTVVNLNYTSGGDGIQAASRIAGLRSIVTSRAFMEKFPLPLPEDVDIVWAEDLAQSVSSVDRILGASLAIACPTRILERVCGARRRIHIDDTATVIFSSGSTGDPKGVKLSHFNILSNIEAVEQVIAFEPLDRVLGILPLFHSFGYLVFWLSSRSQISTVLYANPLDGSTIGRLIEKHAVTHLVATPTFLRIYLERCRPKQFASVRMVVVGAERLQPALRQKFESRFDSLLLEGYGTTECSPVVAVSTEGYQDRHRRQIGSKPGFVGHPLPGVAIRIVDPDSFERLSEGEAGMILVRGPNVMEGYLGRDDLTASAVQEGWYVTGDIGVVDTDGYLKITDRLSRFSKIGGEMIPHGRIEDLLHEMADSDDQVFAVTGIADAKRGERLAVLHTLDDQHIPTILQKMRDRELPNIYIPQRKLFMKVDALPFLGSGKLDLREIRDRARKRFESLPKGRQDS